MTGTSESARAAFLYGLPTVDLYRILHGFALDPTSPEFKAPLNEIYHSRRLADPSDRSIVAMNVDTPYSYAWLDLRSEPVVLTMPPLDGDRYQAAELIDLYTYIVGYVSPRTNGSGGGSFLIAGPGSNGDESGTLPVFNCPTDLCLVLVRTQLFGNDDLPNVAGLQDLVTVQPLSQWSGSQPPPAAEPLVPIPPVDVRRPPDTDFLEVLAWMLRLMPVLPEDVATRHDVQALVDTISGPATPVQLNQVREGLGKGMEHLAQRMRKVRSSAELFGSREFFAGDHCSRAAGAYLGILGNAAEEYLGVGYPGDENGDPFEGATSYTITFAPDGLPPVDAFWSITLYDKDQFLYANELDRYVLGSRQVADMTRGSDGSLTILVQHEAPPEEDLANWLPCPPDAFTLTFRTYLPLMEIRQGLWTAPPVRRNTGTPTS